MIMETRDIFEQMASQYDTEERKSIAHIIAQKVRSELTDTKSLSALDYGCGTGLLGLELVDMFRTMLFVDTSPQMIAQVQRKIENAHIGTAGTLCCDFCVEPCNVKTDFVLMSQVLLHVKDYALLLNRLYQILNQDGHLIVVDFDLNERIVSDKVHHGFEQSELMLLLKQIGFASVHANTFYHGQKMFMKEDASLFLLHAQKET
jgi:ubiquinone/menaquinone biosynthesis C-methylase UbiE